MSLPLAHTEASKDADREEKPEVPPGSTLYVFVWAENGFCFTRANSDKWPHSYNPHVYQDKSSTSKEWFVYRLSQR